MRSTSMGTGCRSPTRPPGSVLDRGAARADRTGRPRGCASRRPNSAFPDARTALLVPMMHRGSGLGVLAAFDRGERAGPFTESDEHLLQTFAASAANAVAIARSVEADRLRSSLAAADAERRRWARELHDDTLQVLGGLRVLLSGTLRRGDRDKFEAAIREAIEHDRAGDRRVCETIIADLRPAALDELGLSRRSRRCSSAAATQSSRSKRSLTCPSRAPPIDRLTRSSRRRSIDLSRNRSRTSSSTRARTSSTSR